MAINKAVSKPPKSHGGLRNTIEYVLKDEKVKEGYLEITGPFSEQDIISPVAGTWNNPHGLKKRRYGIRTLVGCVPIM